MIDDYWQIPYECQRGYNQEDEFFYLQLNQEEEFSSDFIQNLLYEFIPENNISAPNNTPSINNETYNVTQPINNEIVDVAQMEENPFDIQNVILKNKPKRSPKRAVPMTYESKKFKQAFYSFSGKNHFPKSIVHKIFKFELIPKLKLKKGTRNEQRQNDFYFVDYLPDANKILRYLDEKKDDLIENYLKEYFEERKIAKEKREEKKKEKLNLAFRFLKD